MERKEFEPFGAPIVPTGGIRAQSAASRRLTLIGSGVFWILAVTIVVARAAFFEPGIFDGFKQAVAFFHGFTRRLFHGRKLPSFALQ
jgi:hypothetical protein